MQNSEKRQTTGNAPRRPRRGQRYGTSARKRRSRMQSLLFSRGIWAACGALALIAIVVCVVIFRGSPAPDPSVPADAPLETAEPAAAETAAPEPEDTPEPTAEANAEASEPAVERDYQILDGIPQTDRALGLPEGEMVDDSYFNDTIFVGDSISLKLQQFVIRYRKAYPTMLGNAEFLVAGSFSTHAALADVSNDSLHPMVDGVKMTVEDALAAKGAKKVYIMLGMNDVSHSGLGGSIGNMGSLLYRIRQKLPDIEIFVQSVTPRYSGSKPNNQQLFDYDINLYDQITKLGDPKIHFVDVAYVMRDEEGKLYDSYCSDKDDLAMHFTDVACQEWIRYLYTHTIA